MNLMDPSNRFFSEAVSKNQLMHSYSESRQVHREHEYCVKKLLFEFSHHNLALPVFKGKLLEN